MNQLYREISEQPEVFRRIARTYVNEETFASWRDDHSGTIYLTGMGSSLFAAYPAYLHLLSRGFPVVFTDASELLHYGLPGVKNGDTLVLVSQSGESYEVLEILNRLSSRPRILAFTSSLKSTLAQKADKTFDILSGTEYAVTSTKTHTATLVTLNLWALAQTGEREAFLHASLDLELLAEEAERLIASAPEWTKKILGALEFARNAETKVIIARGPALASAWHGCLLMYECAKETFLSFSGGQFRHGPLELATKTMLAVILALPGKTQEILLRLAEELAERGVGVLVIGQGEKLRYNVEVLPLHFPNEFFAPALAVIPLMLFAYTLAEDKGIEPGKTFLIQKTTVRE
ncbi:MAG: SIS domain-containing protein [Candidatus Caldatribacterium sp.]|nr:SIS domain-containing protein [Candidatus Caldatribacterium sp.]